MSCKTWQEKVNEAVDLKHLAEILNCASRELGADIEVFIDIAGLPVFDDEWLPARYEGIWSWDKTHYLGGERGKWILVRKEDWS